MSDPSPILVIGSQGQVGWEICTLLRARNLNYICLNRSECDLAVPGMAVGCIRKLKPRAIINAAAFTAVDGAESQPALARQVNGIAVGEIADAAKQLGSLLVHYSTDYVFDGEKAGPYVEDDPTAPLNEYGRSKRLGEEAVLQSGAAAFIFRTSWVYGAYGSNFLRTMLKLGAERDELKVIADQVGAPTPSRLLAELALFTVAHFTGANGETDLSSAAKLSGIYHATCEGFTTWHGFAQAIFEHARAVGLPMRVSQVKQIGSDEWVSAAKRPRNSVLSNEKLHAQLGFKLPEWRLALTSVMNEVAAGEHPAQRTT